MIKLVFALAGSLLAASSVALAGDTPRPADASAYIISPANGEVVTSPVKVVFGLSGMGIAPAGVEKENTGHHHLLIDVRPDMIDFGNPLQADENYVHFGGGQTEAVIELSEGDHTLMLLLADHNHTPHDPPVMSPPITITVR